MPRLRYIVRCAPTSGLAAQLCTILDQPPEICVLAVAVPAAALALMTAEAAEALRARHPELEIEPDVQYHPSSTR